MEAKKSKASIFWVIVLLVVASVLVFLPQRSTDEFEGTLVEQLTLEPFVMPSDGMGVVKSTADLKGKITFISFWATWCGPCRRELPHLGAIVNRFREDPDIQIWTILLDQPLDQQVQETVHALFDEAEVSLPVYVLSGPLEPTLLMPATIPAALLIGPDGKVVRSWRGYNPDLESEVAKAIAELR